MKSIQHKNVEDVFAWALLVLCVDNEKRHK